MKKFQFKITSMLLVADSISFILALNLAFYLRNSVATIQPFLIYLKALPIATLLLITIFYFTDLYSPQKRINQYLYLLQLIKSISLWFIIIMSISYLIKYDFSRILVLLTFFFSIILNIILRLTIYYFEISQIKNGNYTTNILIIGAGRPARDLSRRIQNYHLLGYRILGYVDNEAKSRKNFPILGTINQIPSIIKSYQINEVFIINPSLSHQQILKLSAKCLTLPVNIRIVSNIFNLVNGPIDQAQIFTIPSLNLHSAQHNWWAIFPKRFFDLIISLSLLCFFLPILIIISLLIIILDHNQPLFLQPRVGHNNQHFLIYKFKTIKNNKVTSLGIFLRRTSLDELPQLINIIKGEMSLVGPRPEVPSKTTHYQSWQRTRTLVKPGLTGLWQILGRKDLPLSQNLEYDFYYISNQSFKLDLEIMLKTLPAVISQKGAY